MNIWVDLVLPMKALAAAISAAGGSVRHQFQNPCRARHDHPIEGTGPVRDETGTNEQSWATRELTDVSGGTAGDSSRPYVLTAVRDQRPIGPVLPLRVHGDAFRDSKRQRERLVTTRLDHAQRAADMCTISAAKVEPLSLGCRQKGNLLWQFAYARTGKSADCAHF